jgi:hypothetical protein
MKLRENLWDSTIDIIMIVSILGLYVFFGLIGLGILHWLYHALQLDILTQWMLD